MVTVPASGAGLSPADLERIRDVLAAGRKPKVLFTASAGQIAGQVGQVVALTDPQLSDEWLTVRFGRDELPFSPADLAIAPRLAPARRAGASVPNPREESQLPAQRPAAPKPPAAESRPQPSGEPDGAGPATARAASKRADPQPPRTVDAAGAPPKPAPRVGAEAKSGRRAGRGRPTPALTVTLGYADGEWTVSAAQGNKVLARPCAVRPAEALKMVAMLDVPGVHEAVAEIVTAARTRAQQQADRLRAELAEVEARLADLREEP